MLSDRRPTELPYRHSGSGLDSCVYAWSNTSRTTLPTFRYCVDKKISKMHICLKETVL